MKHKIRVLANIVIGYCILGTQPALAGQVTIPHSFTADTPAVAAEVNANFDEVTTQVNDNDSRVTVNASDIAALQTAINTLQSTVNQLESDLATANTTIASFQTAMLGKADVGHNHDGQYASNTHTHDGDYAPTSHSHDQADITGLTNTLNSHSSQISAINNTDVMALDPYLSLTNDSRGPLFTFSGINLQLVNGSGTTQSANGLGNLLIGYDTENTSGKNYCAGGGYVLQALCTSNGETWSDSHKSGSHYLVVGDQNNYSQYGGIVSGFRNTSTGPYASVTGGTNNGAVGERSSVTAGFNNQAIGNQSSISGGAAHIASGINSSISGGYGNEALGDTSSISGGAFNTANGLDSSISGGDNNTADSEKSSILGGFQQTTTLLRETIPPTP